MASTLTCMVFWKALGTVIFAHTLKFPSHDSKRQTDNAVQISFSRLKRAGAARFDNIIGAIRTALTELPGSVCLATHFRYNEITT